MAERRRIAVDPLDVIGLVLVARQLRQCLNRVGREGASVVGDDLADRPEPEPPAVVSCVAVPPDEGIEKMFVVRASVMRS